MDFYAVFMDFSAGNPPPGTFPGRVKKFFASGGLKCCMHAIILKARMRGNGEAAPADALPQGAAVRIFFAHAFACVQ